MVAEGLSVLHAVYGAIYTQTNAKMELEALKHGSVEYLNAPAKIDTVSEVDFLTSTARQWRLWQARQDARARPSAS